MATLELEKGILTGTSSKWVLDPAHSELLFKVKHLMISNVKGEFRNFHASILSETGDITKGKVITKIEAASIFTNNEQRDGHLKSADFFDVENYKDITFESTAIEKNDEESFNLTGALTMKGISKEITLNVEFGGTAMDPFGNKKAGFTFSGQINRKDWGLNYNAVLETGGVLVSDEVKISGEVQFVQDSSK